MVKYEVYVPKARLADPLVVSALAIAQASFGGATLSQTQGAWEHGGRSYVESVVVHQYIAKGVATKPLPHSLLALVSALKGAGEVEVLVTAHEVIAEFL